MHPKDARVFVVRLGWIDVRDDGVRLTDEGREALVKGEE